MMTTNIEYVKKNSVFAGFLAVLLAMISLSSGLLGLTLVAFHIVLAIVSPAITPHDFKDVNAQIILNAPSYEHLFGTDSLGRDVLTRTMLGGRQALLVTTIATILAITWGGFLGVLLGLVGGRLDEFLMRIVDAFLCLPWILVLLLIVVMVGSDPGVLIATLGFFYGIPVVRVARAATHDVVAQDFVTAARADLPLFGASSRPMCSTFYWSKAPCVGHGCCWRSVLCHFSGSVSRRLRRIGA
jgi:peptide/nickel transport system permease protein